MPRFPLVDDRGFVIGTITTNDDVLSECVIQGLEYRLGGAWVRGEFVSYLITVLQEVDKGTIRAAVESVQAALNNYEADLYPQDRMKLLDSLDKLNELAEAGLV